MERKILTPEQWVELDIRLRAGESMRSLARVYGISEGAIRKRTKKDYAPQMMEVATLLASKKETAIQADLALSKFPISLHARAFSMAESLLELRRTLLQSSELGAKTSLKLQSMANIQASTLDDASPSPDTLRMIHGLTETANKAAYQPLELLKANKDSIAESIKDSDPINTVSAPVYRIANA